MMTHHADVQIFGIRHHGPGSARSLLRALERYAPDTVLIEGPSDATDVIPLVLHPDMKPPVALLIYDVDDPKKAGYYPFAEFSPEWNAIRYALMHNLPVRFIDLSLAHQFDDPVETPEEEPAEPKEASEEDKVRSDPLGALAKAAGYEDGERWWERMVEQRQNSTDIFEALLEAMTALRDTLTDEVMPKREVLREATMRNGIREAIAAGFGKIAVVCGAFHGPALAKLPPASQDQALLKGLKKPYVNATWVPWTHGRLTMWSGYGAGIWSPGWYQHLWENEREVGERWLTKVAHLLRTEDLDASTAQVIDALRMAEMLATLRDQTTPGLEEFNEATRTVLCFGDEMPIKLIQKKLIVGEQIGDVPDETPMIPIQLDLQREQRRLRMRPDPEPSTLNLDLRKPQHLERSYLLHRLTLLEVVWGVKESVQGKQGTFHEAWKLVWTPELTIRLIEKSAWGNTIHDAAGAYAEHVAEEAPDLPTLTKLIHEVLLADLADFVEKIVARLRDVSAVTTDVTQLMGSLPPLADVLAYGNVRGTDAGMVGTVIDGMLARTWINLPGACLNLADDAADAMMNLFISFHAAIRLLNKLDYTEAWHHVLRQIVESSGIHGLIAGRACRILLDDEMLDATEAGRIMGLSMVATIDPAQSAAWLEGFLRGSGTVLLHHEGLLRIINDWVMRMEETGFIAMLPLLRRTFSSFTDAERRQIGMLIRGRHQQDEEESLDMTCSSEVVSVIATLMGITLTPDSQEPQLD
jgi:hypothetical protein